LKSKFVCPFHIIKILRFLELIHTKLLVILVMRQHQV